MKHFKIYKKYFLLLALLLVMQSRAFSQTDMDAIMMYKNQLCIGPTYEYSSWKKLFWEGTLKRDNQNLGRVTTQSFNFMGAYGIKNNLNVFIQCSLCMDARFCRNFTRAARHPGFISLDKMDAIFKKTKGKKTHFLYLRSEAFPHRFQAIHPICFPCLLVCIQPISLQELWAIILSINFL